MNTVLVHSVRNFVPRLLGCMKTNWMNSSVEIANPDLHVRARDAYQTGCNMMN
jgi:hypothetical protein